MEIAAIITIAAKADVLDSPLMDLICCLLVSSEGNVANRAPKCMILKSKGSAEAAFNVIAK
jgi:hypothetical protein